MRTPWPPTTPTLPSEHFRDGVHVLDLNLVTLNENLARLTERAERYPGCN